MSGHKSIARAHAPAVVAVGKEYYRPDGLWQAQTAKEHPVLDADFYSAGDVHDLEYLRATKVHFLAYAYIPTGGNSENPLEWEEYEEIGSLFLPISESPILRGPYS